VMQVIFTPMARAEIVDAHDWYETRHSGLGSRFLEEVGAIVLRVEENPHQFPVCGNFPTVCSFMSRMRPLS
jgi:hypothetical protein